MERAKKIFTVVTAVAITVTIAVASASLLGIAITGFYPGIVVLLLLTLIPLSAHFYAKQMIRKSPAAQRNYYRTLTIINLLIILVVAWMTFVILVDRVLGKVL